MNFLNKHPRYTFTYTYRLRIEKRTNVCVYVYVCVCDMCVCNKNLQRIFSAQAELIWTPFVSFEPAYGPPGPC